MLPDKRLKFLNHDSFQKILNKQSCLDNFWKGNILETLSSLISIIAQNQNGGNGNSLKSLQT